MISSSTESSFLSAAWQLLPVAIATALVMFLVLWQKRVSENAE